MFSLKQSRFVEEYIVDLNGKRAAIRAGYSARSAEVQASRMLRDAKVKKAVESSMKARSKRTDDAEDVGSLNYEPWHAYQRWLASGELRVFVPFGKALVSEIPIVAVRLR
jgi:hypothetical protein